MTQAVSSRARPYASLESLDRALASAESTSRLVDWLLGDDCRDSNSSIGAHEETSPATDNESSKGLTQGRASLLLLRAIREACQPYLDEPARSASGATQNQRRDAPFTATTPAKPTQPHAKAETMTYEEAFPTLSSSNAPLTTAVAPPVNNINKKAKRRIRPATLSTATGGHHSHKGNLVNAPPLNEPGKIVGPIASHARQGTSQATRDGPATPKGTTTPQKSCGPAQEVTPIKERKQPSDRNVEAPKKEEEAAQGEGGTVELTHLVSLYCALVRGCLVPSTALEVHFLIQLLVVPTISSTVVSSSVAATDASAVRVQRALSSASRCRTFASHCLTGLASVLPRRLGPRGLLQDMVQCPPIRKNCPEWVRQLQLELDRKEGLGDGGSASRPPPKLTTSQVAHWTVPFHEDRDSRHRFRSRDEIVIYKNREEAKDAFLHQLRTFLSSRGRVVDRVQNVKQLEDMKFAFRDMVGKLNPSNLAWFAERLFRDLLLQIGLVPVEETDSEVLKLTDQVKLQKLHQRFTSKHPQQRGSSSSGSHGNYANGTTDTNHDLASPATEARTYFPGHQDFFYMFLLSVDSQRLSAHLTATLATTLSGLSSHVGPNSDLEKRCMEMCMVARFLGVLVFAPNWQSATVSPELQVQSGYNGLAQLASVGVPVAGMVVDAYNHRRLIAVVPWIVDLLKLAKRDAVSRASPAYVEVVRLLQEIQLTLTKGGDDDSAPLAVRLSLELFIGEVVGLARLPSVVDAPVLSERPLVSTNDALDLSCGSFSLPSLVAINSNLHELSELVTRLSRVDLSALKSPGSVRKLRPSILSSPGMAVASSPSTEGPAPEPLSSPSVPLTGTLSTIQSKLVETFFHQHRDLKDVCEFASARALPIALASALAGEGREEAAEGSLPPRSEALVRFQSLVEAKLRECVRLALSALVSPSSPGSSPSGIDMAVDLTVGHILRSNEELIKRKFDGHYETFVVAESGAGASKQLFPGTHDGKNNNNNKGDSTHAAERKELANSRLRDLTSPLEALTSQIRSGGVLTVPAAFFDAVLTRLAAIEKDRNHHVPAPAELRPFFESVIGLDEMSGAVFDGCLAVVADGPTDATAGGGAQARWNTIRGFLHIDAGLRRVLSARGLPRARQLVAQPSSLARLVSLGVSESPVQLSALLRDLVDRGTVTSEQVREAVAGREPPCDGAVQAYQYMDEFLAATLGAAPPF